MANCAEPQIQIFATDINDAALETARAGIYGLARLANVSPQRLKNFFAPSGPGFLINKSIRDICIFARQDLANDPPSRAWIHQLPPLFAPLASPLAKARHLAAPLLPQSGWLPDPR